VRFFGGRDDYALDYALLTFMETGIIPDKTGAGKIKFQVEAIYKDATKA
jgi:hypothetical protein